MIASILRLHHHAFVVADQERNRHFIEDLIGLPLVATWCEHSAAYEGMAFCHTFYELVDGSALAFFQMAAPYDAEFLVGPSQPLPPRRAQGRRPRTRGDQ